MKTGGVQVRSQITKVLFASSFLLFINAATCFAQDKTDFKVGDSIYVNIHSGGCVKATVKGIDPKYYVHVEEGGYKGSDAFYNASRLGECKQTPPPENQNNDKPNTGQTVNTGDLKLGDRVDVYLSDNKEGKNRGTILEVNGSTYKVHYDGCSEKYDVSENSMFVRPAATIGTDNSEIKFFAGKWAMTTVGISSAAIAWGKSPGVQINGDGTFVWYQETGKPPVKGKWLPHAKIEGARFGTETQNGIIITDAKGAQWKMYRRKSARDDDDHITIRVMCSGETQMGTRLR